MTLLPKVLYVQIAHGFSAEFRIFERFTQYAGAAIAPHVLYNAYGSDTDGTPRFEALTARHDAPCAIHPLDFGWRPLRPKPPLLTRYRNRARFMMAQLAAVRIAKTIQPDIVVSSQQLWDCYTASVIAGRLGIPQMIHLHYTVGDYLRPWVLARLRTCDQIITVSEFIRDEAIKHGVVPERVRAIMNPVDPLPLPAPDVRERVRRELGVPEGGFLLGNVARLDPQKGQEDILKAFALVVKTYPSARLVLVGSETPWLTGYGESLRALAASLGVADKTVFAGFRRDVPDLLAAMDVFLHPSRHEPFGQATAEASQAGLPVVAYAEGGTMEVAPHGVTALLPAPEAGAAGLADAITALLADASLRQRLGTTGQTRMAQPPFAPQSAADAFVQTVRDVIERRASTGAARSPAPTGAQLPGGSR